MENPTSNITLLNTSILTQYGTYRYRPVELAEAQQLVYEWGFQSAIGHQSTADVLSELLMIHCPVNRVQYEQQVGESALIFKLNGRPEEGKVLSREEIGEIGYTLGMITRIE